MFLPYFRPCRFSVSYLYFAFPLWLTAHPWLYVTRKPLLSLYLLPQLSCTFPCRSLFSPNQPFKARRFLISGSQRARSLAAGGDTSRTTAPSIPCLASTPRGPNRQ